MVTVVPSSSVACVALDGLPGRLRGDRVRGGEGVGHAVVLLGPGHVRGHRLAEGVPGVGESYPVLRALRPGDRRDDGGQVEIEFLGEHDVAGRVVPEVLLLGIGLDQRDVFLGAAGQPQVGQRLVVDREDRAGRAELRAHVADRGPVGDRDRGHAVAVELDELADHAVLAQQFGDGEHEVGGGRAGRHFTGQPEPDHLGDQHADRLAEHGRLGLDAADPPAEDAEPVLHRGVRVGADAGVRVGAHGAIAVAGHDHAGEMLDVDLVHDPGPRRHHLELVKRGLAPAQELKALLVPAIFEVHVALEGVRPAEDVGDDRMVDDELGRDQRVDLRRVAAQGLHRLAHGSQVHDGWHPGQVLHDDACRGELDLGVRLCLGVPVGQRAHVAGGHVEAVLGAQQVLEQDLQAEWEAFGARHGTEPVDLIRRARGGERRAAVKAVPGHQDRGVEIPDFRPGRKRRSPLPRVALIRNGAIGEAWLL